MSLLIHHIRPRFMSQSDLRAPKKLLTEHHLACAAVIAILVAPSAIWVLRDQSVWPWDQSVYGEWTLRTWQAKYAGPLGWLDAWLHVWPGRPPLIAWVGQFFVPFRHLTGGFESAMLLSNLAVAAGTLVLIYRLARECSATWMETVVALIACGGSTFFVGLTHQYLTELLQCFTTASMMFVAWRAERRPVIRTVLLMLITVSLSFAAKASSAPFVLPFLVYATLVLIVTRARVRPTVRNRDALLFVAAAAIAAATVAWYVINWEATVAHFIEATTGKEALSYGSPVALSMKLRYWISTLGAALSAVTVISAAICIVIMLGIVVAVVRLWKVPLGDLISVAIENGTLFALVLTATILLTLLTFSFQINEDTRYVLSLIPMIAILLSWSSVCSSAKNTDRGFFMCPRRKHGRCEFFFLWPECPERRRHALELATSPRSKRHRVAVYSCAGQLSSGECKSHQSVYRQLHKIERPLGKFLCGKKFLHDRLSLLLFVARLR